MASICLAPVPFTGHPPRRLLRLVEQAPPAVALGPRTYARRRAAAVVVLALTAFAFHAASSTIIGWAQAGVPGGAATAPPPGLAVDVHAAEPGETLWSLAAELGPDRDLRANVDELLRLNGSPSIVAGKPVYVPRSWEAP